MSSSTLPPQVSQETYDSLPVALQEQVPYYNDSIQPKIRAVLGITTIIAYVALGLRLWARHITKQHFGIDDLFVALAVLFFTISVGLVAYLVHLYTGRHEVVLVVEHIDWFGALNRTLVATSVIYVPIIFCTKASALFLYRRLFAVRRFHNVCYGILAFTGAYCIATILLLTIQCLPPNPPTEEQPVAQLKCPNLDLGLYLIIILIVNVLLDAIILCLPLPLIWRLQTTRKRKLQLTLIFTLGAFALIFGVMRVYSVLAMDPEDDNWDTAPIHLWSCAEASMTVVAVSLPVMQPLVRRAYYRSDGSRRITMTPKSKSKSSGSESNGNNSNNKKNSPGISLLTIGRMGRRDQKAKRPRGLDVTTLATAAGTTKVGTETAIDTYFDASATRLVTMDRDSPDLPQAVYPPQSTSYPPQSSRGVLQSSGRDSYYQPESSHDHEIPFYQPESYDPQTIQYQQSPHLQGHT